MTNNDLTYNNAFEAVFGRGSEKAKDFETLSLLAMKYKDEVQLFFGTRAELRYLEELELAEMERNGVEVVRD